MEPQTRSRRRGRRLRTASLMPLPYRVGGEMMYLRSVILTTNQVMYLRNVVPATNQVTYLRSVDLAISRMTYLRNANPATSHEMR